MNQSKQNVDAVFIVGPLSVAGYQNLGVTYYWKAGSISKTYTTNLYYSTDAKNYTEVKRTSGEGATKFIEANVCGAKDENDAKLAAKSIVSSSLFKSAVFGGDPNWGRIVSAIGYSGCDLNPDIVTIAIANSDDEVDLVKDGTILAFEDTPNLERAAKVMQSKYVSVNIDMHLGDGQATAWGCDLTYDYVKINAEYTT